MSDIVIVALIAAVPATIGAILSVKNGRKADAIHVLVNSNLTAVKVELAVAKTEIGMLREMVLSLSKEKP